MHSVYNIVYIVYICALVTTRAWSLISVIVERSCSTAARRAERTHTAAPPAPLCSEYTDVYSSHAKISNGLTSGSIIF